MRVLIGVDGGEMNREGSGLCTGKTTIFVADPPTVFGGSGLITSLTIGGSCNLKAALSSSILQVL